MKKYLFLILPLVAMLFMSCEKEISLELINSSYVTPADGVIPAEGGEIVIKVASTHSFKMTSPSSAFSFFKEGIVNYNQEGVAVVETEHMVHVDANETGKERHMHIVATQLHNQDISTSLVFLQPAKQE